MDVKHRPLSLFGVSLKKLLAALVFLSILAVAIRPTDITSFFSKLLTPGGQKNTGQNQYHQQDTHITATPEMISAAQKELHAERMREYETAENSSPTDRFFYVIELHDGGDLEAAAITIEPDLVTIMSQSGIKTVIPRASVKKVNRYKLPDLPPAPQ